MTNPRLIDAQGDLQRLAREIAGQKILAIDTESNSFFVYRERVCLLQLSSPETHVLIDPLALVDLSALAPVLEDPGVVKVMHDAEQDLPGLKRDFGIKLRGLFDTKVAAAALGDERVGLASQVEKHLGIKLDKSKQRSDWGQRPLSESQLRYATADTQHLIALHKALSSLLAKAPTLVQRLAEAEMRRFEELPVVLRRTRPDDFVKLPGVGRLDRQGQRCLRELFWARERWAREADMPPAKAVGNKILLALASLGQSGAWPPDPRILARRIQCPPRLVQRHGWMLRSLERARDKGPLPRRVDVAKVRGTDLPKAREVDDLKKLRRWRNAQAARLHVDPALIARKALLEQIARRPPREPSDLQFLDFADWWVEAFGASLLAALRA